MLVRGVSDNASSDAGGVLFQHRERMLSFGLRNERGESSLASDMERVQAENLARRAHIFANRDQFFIDLQREVGGFRDFIENARQSAACEVAQAMDVDAGLQHISDRSPERCGVTFDLTFEFESFT